MHEFWLNINNKLEALIAENKVDQFLESSDILGTMFFADQNVGMTEYKILTQSADIQRYGKALEDPPIIPEHLRFDYNKQTSLNTIHHLLHIHIFERNAGVEVQNLSKICELGAGFGSTPRIISKLGFTGEYFVIDIPAMRKIQEYYLKESNCSLNIKWVDSVPKDIDLFIAEWSLSKMFLEEQVKYIDIQCPYFLIASSIKFETQDNTAFLKRFIEIQEKNHKIIVLEMDQFNNKNNIYIIGAPK